MRQKTLLIVGGGIETVPAVNMAHKMGLYVVVSDVSAEAPALLASDEHLISSTYDVIGTVRAAQEYHRYSRPIDGVMCIASDVPLTVASVAAALGLPGIQIESARLATDKLAMKQRFAADGVSIPWYSPAESADHLRALIASEGLPLVIKPVDSRGSRGVLRLLPETDVEWAFAMAKGHSPTGRVMLERFLSGPQVSTESLVVDGVAHTPGFADRNYEYLERYAPHIIENGGQLPSHLDDVTQQEVRDLVQQAAQSMGIRNGVVKGDIVVTDGKPHVIELAARLSGGYFCTHEIPLNTGVDLVGAAIRQALGAPVDPKDLQPKYNQPVAQRYLLPGAGRLRAISGIEEAKGVAGVEELLVTAKPGDILRDPSDSNCSAAMVIATGVSREGATASAVQAINLLRVDMETV